MATKSNGGGNRSVRSGPSRSAASPSSASKAKVNSGGGATSNKVRQLATPGGPPRTQVVSPAGTANIGIAKGNHAENKTVAAPKQPLVTGTRAQVGLGNALTKTTAVNHGKSGTQAMHGPANSGMNGPSRPLDGGPAGFGFRKGD